MSLNSGDYEDDIEEGAPLLREQSTHSGDGVELLFEDVVYEVSTARGRRVTVLDGVTGVVGPGLTYVLGPHGCGKSALLQVLSSRLDNTLAKGTILANGMPIATRQFKRLTGLVTREGVVMGVLTVYENLMYSARLRMPKTVAAAQRSRRVQAVMDELNLTDIADRRVGTELIKGVSASQRQRCNIGMELILNPSVLFLDQPTNNMDPVAALAMMDLLKGMASRGKTVIVALDRPENAIYQLCDNVILLDSGKTVFSGPAQRALEYFGTLGHPCPLHDNPVDFMMHCVLSRRRQLPPLFKQSQEFTQLRRRLAASYNKTHELLTDRGEAPGELQNFVVIATSLLRQAFFDPSISVFEVGLATLFAVLTGLVYFNFKQEMDNTGLQNRVGSLFFVLVSTLVLETGKMASFVKAHPVILHQNAGGYFRRPTYFLALVMVHVLLLPALKACLVGTILYLMFSFQRVPEKLFIFLATLAMTSTAFSALCLAVASISSTFATASTVVNTIVVLFMVFTGLLVNLHTIPTYLVVLEYASLLRHGYEILVVTELGGLRFCDDPPLNCCVNGNDYILEQGFDPKNVGTCFQRLAIYLGVNFALAGIAFLRSKNRPSVSA